MIHVCVYCASSELVERSHFVLAEELGQRMVERRFGLVYGGGNIGLMGKLARTIHSGGGHVIGIIPEALRDRELAYNDSDELIVTRDLRERKGIMEERSDAFLTLPGGFGTLEEFVEILTLRQLGLHKKPIVLLDHDGYYADLLKHFARLVTARFATNSALDCFSVAGTVAEALEIIARDA